MPLITPEQHPCVILRPPQAAAYIGLTVSTLAKRRVRGERPHFVRLGMKSVGYHVAELDAWLADCRRSSTSGDRTDQPDRSHGTAPPPSAGIVKV